MLDGFIKCAAATPDLRIADCRYNCGEILCLINEADKNGVKLLVFPELSITGCTCMDLFSDGVLLEGAERAVLEIAEKSAGKDMLITVGAPLRCGGRLFNCAVVIKDGHILGVIPKKRPVNFGTGYELRNFAPAPDLADEITLGGENIPFGNDLLFCCDDLPEFIYSAAVGSDINVAFPADAELSAAGAVIIGVPAADIETVCAADRRRKLLEAHSAELVCGYIHAGCGRNESTQDVIYGGRRIIAEMGHILSESGVFTEGLTISEIDVKKLARERMRNTSFGAEELSFRRIRFGMDISETALTRYIRRLPFIPEDTAEYDRRCGDILMIQAQALARRVRHTNAGKLVIGISGGLDSTLALLVAVETMKLLGRENRDILTVTMPCFGTTARTRSNAEKLCIMLGTDFRTIDIMASVKQHFSDIGHDESVHDVVYENSQARERTQILMDIANAENGMVVGTGDLSELALGWATYNGDHMSMYGVNGSVPKTLVRHIVKYYAGRVENEELRDTLISVYDTPVSPELLPADENGDIAQKTEDLVGPYELHDFFLYYAVRWGYSPKKIFRLALYAFGEEYDRGTVLKWLKTFFRRFFNQQFKRSCLPDGVKVGSVGLSPRGDLRMPSDATSALWQSELEGLE